MSQMLHRLTGIHKKLEVYDDKIIIIQTSMLDKLARGFQGDKSIYYKNLSAVQIQKPMALTNGYIQFTLAGGTEDTKGLFSATKDENSVFFQSDKYPLVLKIKDTIDRLIANTHNSVVVQTQSFADELMKYQEMLANNIITLEEFERLKTKLLNS